MIFEWFAVEVQALSIDRDANFLVDQALYAADGVGIGHPDVVEVVGGLQFHEDLEEHAATCAHQSQRRSVRDAVVSQGQLIFRWEGDGRVPLHADCVAAVELETLAERTDPNLSSFSFSFSDLTESDLSTSNL